MTKNRYGATETLRQLQRKELEKEARQHVEQKEMGNIYR